MGGRGRGGRKGLQRCAHPKPLLPTETQIYADASGKLQASVSSNVTDESQITCQAYIRSLRVLPCAWSMPHTGDAAMFKTAHIPEGDKQVS